MNDSEGMKGREKSCSTEPQGEYLPSQVHKHLTWCLSFTSMWSFAHWGHAFPCSVGPTCSDSWCLCSAEDFSSSAMRVCCCCTTERRCFTQLWFGSSSLGISRLPRVGKRTGALNGTRGQRQQLAKRAFSYPTFQHALISNLFLFTLLPRPFSPLLYLLSLGFCPSLRQYFT